MENLPSISVVIATLNSEKTLEECLEGIRTQEYPEGKITIIIADGGSSDKTIEIAEKFKSEILISKADRDNQERRKALGVMSAENEIVALIDSDNILPHKKWFQKMVEPFIEDSNIIATQPLRYAYRREHSLMNRYFALFGVNDPVAYYLNKRDRLSWAEDKWNLLGEAEDRGAYYSVKFEPNAVPTLGANGFLVRREIFLKSRCSPAEFLHIDVNCDLIGLGYNNYGIVKDEIIHLTGNTFWSFFSKRLLYMKKYYLQDQSLRRYHMYSPSDKWNLFKFIFFSITFVKPLYDSFRGYRKIKDVAWFLHPLMCIVILFVYGLAIISNSLRKNS